MLLHFTHASSLLISRTLIQNLNLFIVSKIFIVESVNFDVEKRVKASIWETSFLSPGQTLNRFLKKEFPFRRQFALCLQSIV